MSNSTPSYAESYTDEEHETAWGDGGLACDDDFDEPDTYIEDDEE